MILANPVDVLEMSTWFLTYEHVHAGLKPICPEDLGPAPNSKIFLSCCFPEKLWPGRSHGLDGKGSPVACCASKHQTGVYTSGSAAGVSRCGAGASQAASRGAEICS